MGFFEDLFGQALPGGTPAGNLLRKATNEISGGILGNGAAKISQIDYDLKNLTDEEYIQKYAKTKTGVPVTGVVANPAITAVDQQLRSGMNARSSIGVTVKSLMRRYWFLFLALIGFPLAWLLSKLFSKRNNNYYRNRKKR